MTDLSGKHGLVVGVANKRSISWAIAQAAAAAGARLALTYPSERLEENVSELGAKLIRVNAISAGPIKTLAASGISGFSNILQVYRDRAPLRRNVELGEVADAAMFLLGPASRAVTGEIVMVDGGYHVFGGI